MEKIEQIELMMVGVCSTLLGLGLNSLLPKEMVYFNNPKTLIFLAFSIPFVFYAIRLEFHILKKLYIKLFNKIRSD